MFRNFLIKYAGKEIYDVSILHKNDLTGCYEERIKNNMKNVNCQKKNLFL